jgi:hypothetical protein
MQHRSDLSFTPDCGGCRPAETRIAGNFIQLEFYHTGDQRHEQAESPLGFKGMKEILR